MPRELLPSTTWNLGTDQFPGSGTLGSGPMFEGTTVRQGPGDIDDGFSHGLQHHGIGFEMKTEEGPTIRQQAKAKEIIICSFDREGVQTILSSYR